MHFEDSECESSDEIMKTMRKDAGTQAAPVQHEQTEESAEDDEQHHVAQALISMRRAEEHCGKEDAEEDIAARPRSELALEVTAKDGLLHDADEEAKQRPCRRLLEVGRRDLQHGALGRIV